MSVRALAGVVVGLALSALALSPLSCGGARVHPGHTVVRSKCTSCHAEPELEELRNVDLTALLNEHSQERITLDPEQTQLLMDYVDKGDPPAEGEADPATQP